MTIPKSIRVGERRYTVKRMERAVNGTGRPVYGTINYTGAEILVGRRQPDSGRPLTERQQAQTFWHEMTHAILRDMGHRLEANEEFVDAFAVRLNEAIHSAKL